VPRGLRIAVALPDEIRWGGVPPGAGGRSAMPARSGIGPARATRSIGNRPKCTIRSRLANILMRNMISV
jgi:hypothetical protein